MGSDDGGQGNGRAADPQAAGRDSERPDQDDNQWLTERKGIILL